MTLTFYPQTGGDKLQWPDLKHQLLVKLGHYGEGVRARLHFPVPVYCPEMLLSFLDPKSMFLIYRWLPGLVVALCGQLLA